MIFKTPRKLVHSLQDLNEANSDHASKSFRRAYRSLSSGNLEWSPRSSFHNQNGFPDDQKLSKEDVGGLDINGEQSQGGSESVSSTDGIPAHTDIQATPVEVAYQSNMKTQCSGIEMAYKKTALKLVCGFSFLLFTVFTSFLLINDQDQGSYLVPT